MNKYSTGRLITRATNDAAALNEMFTDVFVSLFKDIVLIIGIIIAMFQLDKSALIGLTAVPFIALVTYYFEASLEEFKLVKSLIGQINGFWLKLIRYEMDFRYLIGKLKSKENLRVKRKI